MFHEVIFFSNILKYVVIKASRDIKEGEEVTNCYGKYKAYNNSIIYIYITIF